ncbi:phage tail tube protein [Micromonosporaceae bacterium Da 78-11]
MAVDITKIRAYVNGLVSVSGYGVTNPTLPTDATTALNSSVYKELGALSDDGIAETTEQDFNDVFMWQNNALAASLPGQYVKSFKVTCLEQNSQTLGISFAGSTLTQQAWGVSIAEKASGRDIRTWVLHGIDGARLYRIVVPLGQVVGKGDITWSSTEVVAQEFEIKAFPDASNNYSYRYIYDSLLVL